MTSTNVQDVLSIAPLCAANKLSLLQAFVLQHRICLSPVVTAAQVRAQPALKFTNVPLLKDII